MVTVRESLPPADYDRTGVSSSSHGFVTVASSLLPIGAASLQKREDSVSRRDEGWLSLLKRLVPWVNSR